MISFEQCVLEDGSPIYLQILQYIKRGMVAGTIRDGDELPSRRLLSALLGVNPNTVQKAYRQLEEEGLILSHAGAGSHIRLDDKALAAVRSQLLQAQALQAAAALRQMGIGLAEAQALLAAVWEQNGEDAR